MLIYLEIILSLLILEPALERVLNFSLCGCALCCFLHPINLFNFRFYTYLRDTFEKHHPKKKIIFLDFFFSELFFWKIFLTIFFSKLNSKIHFPNNELPESLFGKHFPLFGMDFLVGHVPSFWNPLSGRTNHLPKCF